MFHWCQWRWGEWPQWRPHGRYWRQWRCSTGDHWNHIIMEPMDPLDMAILPSQSPLISVKGSFWIPMAPIVPVLPMKHRHWRQSWNMNIIHLFHWMGQLAPMAQITPLTKLFDHFSFYPLFFQHCISWVMYDCLELETMEKSRNCYQTFMYFCYHLFFYSHPYFSFLNFLIVIFLS